MPVILKTVGLLVASNTFMMFAWYMHLKKFPTSALWIAILVSWLIALPEYILHVPAHRAGFTAYSLPQLKVLQEVIHLAIFVPFAILYMRQPVRLDFLWAGMCLVGAVYFIFRGASAS